MIISMFVDDASRVIIGKNEAIIDIELIVISPQFTNIDDMLYKMFYLRLVFFVKTHCEFLHVGDSSCIVVLYFDKDGLHYLIIRGKYYWLRFMITRRNY